MGSAARSSRALIPVDAGASQLTANRKRMHDPARDPFFEGLWADVQEGIDEANRGELLDGEEVFAELLGEERATAATVD